MSKRISPLLGARILIIFEQSQILTRVSHMLVSLKLMMVNLVHNKPSFVNATLTGTVLSIIGNASLSDVGGTHVLTVNCTDSFTAVQDTLTINIAENYAPSIPSMSTTIIVKEGVNDTQTLDAFTDAESDPLTYNLLLSDHSALNSSWVQFDPLTRQVNFTLDSDLGVPTVSLTYFASDGHNPITELPLTLNLKYKPNDNPLILARTGAMMVLANSNFTINRNILTDDAVISSYAFELADGTPLPSWVDVTLPSSSASGDFEFNGTYPIFDSTPLEVRIIATDVDGLQGSASFFILPESKFCVVIFSELPL